MTLNGLVTLLGRDLEVIDKDGETSPLHSMWIRNFERHSYQSAM